MFLFELGDVVGSTVDNDPVQLSIQCDRTTATGKLRGNNQQSLSLLCLATSSPLNCCSFGFWSFDSWFILSMIEISRCQLPVRQTRRQERMVAIIARKRILVVKRQGADEETVA